MDIFEWMKGMDTNSNLERGRMKTEKIDHRLLDIFEEAKKENILPSEAANHYAESRIHQIHKLRRV